MNKILVAIGILLVVASCKTNPEARRPVSHGGGSYIDESIARNIKLNEAEEELIEKIIAKDSATEYIASSKGFWYFYNKKDTTAAATPQVGDLITFSYNLKTLDNEVILSQDKLGKQTYQVDQSNQELMPGLRDGVKLLKPGETITFLFPSHKGYGYYGLDNLIGKNLPLKSTVTLHTIENKNPEDKL